MLSEFGLSVFMNFIWNLLKSILISLTALIYCHLKRLVLLSLLRIRVRYLVFVTLIFWVFIARIHLLVHMTSQGELFLKESFRVLDFAFDESIRRPWSEILACTDCFNTKVNYCSADLHGFIESWQKWSLLFDQHKCTKL